jgi:hypothetical protein
VTELAAQLIDNEKLTSPVSDIDTILKKPTLCGLFHFETAVARRV